jgi:hypothetical protein
MQQTSLAFPPRQLIRRDNPFRYPYDRIARKTRAAQRLKFINIGAIERPLSGF